jgi:8-oxo-dGTP pyrophosphatase MutT (NUDIX family)
VEPGERPDQTALREAWEETGVRIRLVGAPLPPFPPCEEDVSAPSPYGLQVYRITPGHEHLDLIYFGIFQDGEPVHDERESLAIAYFSLEEVEDPAFNTYPNIRAWCHFFQENIAMFQKKSPQPMGGKPPDE